MSKENAERKERPEILCHILTSLDGKIDGEFFSHEKTIPALKAYGALRKELDCDGTVYGKTTMLGFCKGELKDLPEFQNTPEKRDYIADHTEENYVISLDPDGTLAFDCAIFDRPGREKAHIIEVLSENVSPDYLAYLKEKGISYLFAGKKELELKKLVKKLKKDFGIRRLMVAGGGITNYSFAKEDLIDTLSLVLAPVAEGDRNAAALFDSGNAETEDEITEKAEILPAFSLKEVKDLDGVLWLLYERE